VNEHDLSAHLLPKKKWQHVVLPLIASQEQSYPTDSGTWRRRKDELLRPDAFGADDIEEMRSSCFNPSFDMLYQQNFDFRALPAITVDHFGTFSGSTDRVGPIVLSIDAGVTNRPRSAYSVIQAWCLAQDRYLLLDQFREQCEYVALRDGLRHFRKRYRPVAILVERAANGNALISDLMPKHASLVVPIDPDGRSKSARLRVHAETIIAKRIWLPQHAPWADEFAKEFAQFPNGDFTDQIDAATQFLDHADKFVGMKPADRVAIAAAAIGRTHANLTSVSNRSPRGIAAGVSGNGTPICGRPRNIPFPKIKVEVKY
jgi:predicted phage terminase large subunit-like protein